MDFPFVTRPIILPLDACHNTSANFIFRLKSFFKKRQTIMKSGLY